MIAPALAAAPAIPTNVGLYLLHLAEPLEGGRRPQHYLGWSEDINRRIGEHLGMTAKGSPLVRAAIERGIPVELARVWIGEGATRHYESALKRQNHAFSRLCPICAESAGVPLLERPSLVSVVHSPLAAPKGASPRAFPVAPLTEEEALQWVRIEAFPDDPGASGELYMDDEELFGPCPPYGTA